MIADYKFFHGVVLAELVNHMVGPISIDELIEEGRLSSYIINNSVGLQVKHSTTRLHPWQFTFTKQNLRQLLSLQQKLGCVYIVFVCNEDGMVTLSLKEVTGILMPGESEQAWIRVDRKRNEWYSVSGGAAALPNKIPQGVQQIVQALSDNR